MNKKLKRPFMGLLVLGMTASLVACQTNDNGNSNASEQPTTNQAATSDPQQNAPAAAADPTGKYETPINLTIAGAEKDPNANYPAGMDDDHNPWKDAYTNELGINFEYKWVVPGAKFAEKLNTQIAAGDVPDIINGLGRAQFDQLIKLGLAAPLDDLIDKYATDLTKQVLDSDGGYSMLMSRGEDGKLYALPYVYGYEDNVPEMWIRTDWLKNLNLQAPKTTDDLYNVLKAFVENDPDKNGKKDTVGLVTSNGLWEANSIFNAFGSQPFWSWYKDTDGKLKYSTVYKSESTKKALDYMNKLYKNGLMDQEFGAATYDKMTETIVSGKTGIAFMPRWVTTAMLNNNVQNDKNADWEAFPIPSGLDGGAPAGPFAYYGAAAYNVVSSKSEHPEAAIKLLNLYIDKIFGPDAQANTETYSMNKDGYDLKTFAVMSSDWANKVDKYVDVAKAVESGDASSLNIDEKNAFDSAMAYKNGNREKWANYKDFGPGNATISVIDYYKKTAIPLFSNYYGPATEAVKQYQGDLDAKWLSLCTQIIMGQKPVSAYDDFVKDWYKLGGDKMEKEVNDYAAAHPDIVK